MRRPNIVSTPGNFGFGGFLGWHYYGLFVSNMLNLKIVKVRIHCGDSFNILNEFKDNKGSCPDSLIR